MLHGLEHNCTQSWSKTSARLWYIIGQGLSLNLWRGLCCITCVSINSVCAILTVIKSKKTPANESSPFFCIYILLHKLTLVSFVSSNVIFTYNDHVIITWFHRLPTFERHFICDDVAYTYLQSIYLNCDFISNLVCSVFCILAIKFMVVFLDCTCRYQHNQSNSRPCLLFIWEKILNVRTQITEISLVGRTMMEVYGFTHW